ncbi:MAG: hypothetical protein GY711_26540 [bacterium]|nr:hypothetical protein [bacterium]
MHLSSHSFRFAFLLAAPLATSGGTILGQVPEFDPMTFATGPGPRAACIADFDLDGVNDLAVAAGFGLNVHFSDGYNGFLPPVQFGAGLRPVAVVAGDLNADCFPDAVVVNQDSDDVSVFLGDGHGGFTTLGPFDTGDWPFDVELGDFDEDGLLDAVTLNLLTGNVQFLRGDGTGTLTFAGGTGIGFDPSDFACGDVDGDSHLDVVVTKRTPGGTVAVLSGDGNGGFVRTPCSPGQDAFQVQIGDFRGAGTDDYVAVIANQTLRLYDGLCGGPITSTGQPVTFRMRSGDIDGDGAPDVVLQTGSMVGPQLNSGTGSFGAFVGMPAVGELVFTGDFNGDGNAEIVTADEAGGTVTVYWNRSSQWTLSPVNNLYYHIAQPGTWVRGELRALSFGAHLATLRSAAQNSWIASFLGDQDVYIGATDAVTEGNWFWTSGEPFVFDNWAVGEPDNGVNSDFCALDATTGEWRDEPETTLLPGLVEVLSSDCDLNGFPDTVEIALGLSADVNGDGFPDDCIAPNYCLANPNSSGGAARIRVTGRPELWRNDLLFVAMAAPPGRFGYYLMSQQAAFVPMFGGGEGNLCLGLPIFRLLSDLLTSTPAGEFVLEFDARTAPPMANLGPGQTWNFQCWFRDVTSGPTSNTSDAVTITFRAGVGPHLLWGGDLTIIEETTQIDALLRVDARSIEDVTVNYALSGTATDIIDFRVEVSNPITIPAGEVCVPIPITIAEDTEIEGNETVILTLFGPSEAILGDPRTMTLVIVDDD